MLMDFTTGGHSGLLLKSSMSKMRLIFLLNWIICIYLPPIATDACLNWREHEGFLRGNRHPPFNPINP